MADRDLELELLALDDDTQRFGEHELKTSPLVSKDALDLSIASRVGGETEGEQFVQRGLLERSSVYTLKTFGISQKIGLVCGVQDWDLASTTFDHCRMVEDRAKAAYLSELKDNQGQGVKEVVVLVSPSNLNIRKKVYSNLKYVKVEALLVVYDGCRQFRVPLYLHTALAILRDMGSDNFSYRAFRKRLDKEEFNKSQLAMLQLRLDLLDSFLKGDGEDITYFFKSGRLVIIDLSDPFVNSTTAAMLFDICLGLFIEWKVSTGKLIGEALLCSPASLFVSESGYLATLSTGYAVIKTRPRLTRDGGASLLATVDLTEAQHRTGLVKPDSETLSSSDSVSTKSAASVRVPDPITGPSVSADVPVAPTTTPTIQSSQTSSNPSPIAPLTKQGDALTQNQSITAASTSQVPTSSFKSLVLPLFTMAPLSPEPPAESSRQTYSSLIQTMRVLNVRTGRFTMPISEVMDELIQTNPMMQSWNLVTYLQCALDSRVIWLARTDQIALHPASPDSSTPNSSNGDQASTNTPTPSNMQSTSFNTSAQEAVSINGVLPPSQSSVSEYRRLIDVMNQLSSLSEPFINTSDIENAYIDRWGNAWSGKFLKYLRGISAKNIVTLRRVGNDTAASLHPSLPSPMPSPRVTVTSSSIPSTTIPGSSSSLTAETSQFQTLIDVIRSLNPGIDQYIHLSKVGVALAMRPSGGFRAAGYKSMKPFIEAAQAIGLVELRGSNGSEMVRLRT
ncbi:hypothetical protein CPB86DRAFT_802757 [Serendipita vermifera]|nr:hypothetical protein CPB86DRAFT_802757 [Serendipita vermifera]